MMTPTRPPGTPCRGGREAVLLDGGGPETVPTVDFCLYGSGLSPECGTRTVSLDALLEQLADLIAERVAARLNGKDPPPASPKGETLLTAAVVAEQLQTSPRWVY